MLDRIGEQRAGGLICGLGEYQMAHGLRHEPKLARGEILLCALKDRGRTAHVFDIFFAGLERRQWIEMNGIGVVPSEVFLVDRFHIVTDLPVVASPMPAYV